MPSLASITAALAFFGVVGASPVELQKRKAFSIDQVERATYIKNGPKQVAKTLRKFGKTVPENIVRAAAAGPNGSAAAVPGDAYDSLYLSPVTIGDTTVHLDFDTGSADL